MSAKTGIEWTDATWNPITGCSKVSQGCKHCYALRDWTRLASNHKTVYSGRAFTDVVCHSERLDKPLRWQKPRMIFVNSMSDLFHEDVPFQFIADVFAVMACTTRHTYQVLTKRPARMLDFFAWLNEELDVFGHPARVDSLRVWPQWTSAHGKRAGYDNCGPLWPLENVWLGVSVENQDAANERIPLLLKTPAAVRWVSIEPLIGSINIDIWLDQLPAVVDQRPRLDWVVVGGESGTHARPMHQNWVRIIRDQCAEAGVPFLFKQWGEWLPDNQNPRVGPPHDENGAIRVGKKAAGRLLDGVKHDGYPVTMVYGGRA